MPEPVIAAVNAVQERLRAVRAKLLLLAGPAIVGVSRDALLAAVEGDVAAIEDHVRRIDAGVRAESLIVAQRALKTTERLTGTPGPCGVPGCTTCEPTDRPTAGECHANGAAPKTRLMSGQELKAAVKSAMSAYEQFTEAAERR